MLQKELPLSPSSDDEYTIHGYYYRKMYEILDYAGRNREVFLCIENSLFRQEFRKIYLEDMRNIFTELVGESEVISSSSKHFADDLVHLLLISSLAVIESWIFEEIKKTPKN